jgi:membrane protease YdiL (CAAX protease family)
MTTGEPKSPGKLVFLTIFIFITFLIVVSYLLVLVMGYEFIFGTPEGLVLSRQFFHFPLYLFFWIGFYTPILSVNALFHVIWIFYVLCFLFAWIWRERLHSVVRRSFSQPFRRAFDNFLFVMPLISSMLFTAVTAIFLLQDSVGIPTGQPVFPENAPSQEIFLNLAFAPVTEELGFRLIPMGLFTVLYVFMVGKNVTGKRFKLFVTALFYPDGAKRMAGLRNIGEHGIRHGISVSEWAMILVVSLFFGYAHVISGIGWEVGKITSAAVTGFFLALTYLAYGFEAPVLLHWFLNYYLFFFDPEVITNFFPTTISILSLTELAIVAFGIAGWILFAGIGLSMLLKRTKTS